MNISLFSNIGSSRLFKSPISRFAAATAIIGLAVFTISKINERLKNASGSGLMQNRTVELTKRIAELESTVKRQADEITDLMNKKNDLSSVADVLMKEQLIKIKALEFEKNELSTKLNNNSISLALATSNLRQNENRIAPLEATNKDLSTQLLECQEENRRLKADKQLG